VNVYHIEVGIAKTRPPQTDEFRKYVLAAESGHEAELTACQWAACAGVMATESNVTDWSDE
jgi:hypothetical protein